MENDACDDQTHNIPLILPKCDEGLDCKPTPKDASRPGKCLKPGTNLRRNFWNTVNSNYFPEAACT